MSPVDPQPVDLGALPPIEVGERIAALAGRLDAIAGVTGDGLDALLVSDLTNLRWLTGFTGSNGWAVVTAEGLAVVTDGRYAVQAAQQMAAGRADSVVPTRVLEGRSVAELHDHIADLVQGHERVGFESAHVSHRDWLAWDESLAATLVPTVGLIERARRTKTPQEVARIAAACTIADQALADVVPRLLRPGVTEVAVRDALEARMRELGASGPSYDTIVAAGCRNASMPHHRPSPTRVDDGDTVIIDVGALVDGYHSDMTRTFLVGEPTLLQREVYDVVLAAQRAGVASVRPGITIRELDATCRRPITAAGYGEWFSHGTGHGVGLLIHEDPFVNASGEGVLQVGDVVTVEPGVYRGDLGGVRVEDLVEVTSDGCRVLTRSPKDSPCLPSPPTN